MYKKRALNRALLLAFGGAVAGSLPVQAQQVTITGSSIKRVEAEGALPVQTLSRADIDRTGAQTTEQLLQTISAMSSSGQTNTAMGAGLSTYGGSGVSLRGLGEERTLVLLNGRRLAPFAGGGGATVNVNNIPLAAIERVEILKDGASAVYGSDAIAGVVQIFTRKGSGGDVSSSSRARTRRPRRRSRALQPGPPGAAGEHRGQGGQTGVTDSDGRVVFTLDRAGPWQEVACLLDADRTRFFFSLRANAFTRNSRTGLPGFLTPFDSPFPDGIIPSCMNWLSPKAS